MDRLFKGVTKLARSDEFNYIRYPGDRIAGHYFISVGLMLFGKALAFIMLPTIGGLMMIAGIIGTFLHAIIALVMWMVYQFTYDTPDREDRLPYKAFALIFSYPMAIKAAWDYIQNKARETRRKKRDNDEHRENQ
jgi:hypothetical protein